MSLENLPLDPIDEIAKYMTSLEAMYIGLILNNMTLLNRYLMDIYPKKCRHCGSFCISDEHLVRIELGTGYANTGESAGCDACHKDYVQRMILKRGNLK